MKPLLLKSSTPHIDEDLMSMVKTPAQSIYMDNLLLWIMLGWPPTILSLPLLINCHINVEWCASFKVFQYLFKYQMKMSDQSYSFQSTLVIHLMKSSNIKPNDMTVLWKQHYIFFNFTITANKPAIMQLPIHLENQQRNTFDPNDASNDQQALQCHQETPLTQYFVANDFPEAHAIFYKHFPEQFVWMKNGLSEGRYLNLHLLLVACILYIPLMKNYSAYACSLYILRDTNHGKMFVPLTIWDTPIVKQHVLLSIWLKMIQSGQSV